MALLVWTMVGLAIWHFTVFLPDNFYGGIVGAFCAALLGSVHLRDHHQPGLDPGAQRHRLPHGPGSDSGHRDRPRPVLVARRAPAQVAAGDGGPSLAKR